MKKNLEIIKKFKNKFIEAWKVPRKKAGIKLLGYFIFLFIFFLIAAIGNNITAKKVQNKTTTTTTTSIKETLSFKQKELLNKSHNIKYEIKINDINYIINGKLNKGVLEGYLEEITGIKKITLYDGTLYEIIDDTNVPLETEINTNYIDINYLLNMTEQNRAYIEEKDNIKTYKYSLYEQETNNIITIFTDANKITKISVVSDLYEYILNFDN